MTEHKAKTISNSPSPYMVYDEAYKQGKAEGVEEGMQEAFRMVLNEIPCQKNCQCCLRDGDASCFIPNDKVWFVKGIVDMIREQLKEQKGETE